MDQGTAIQSPGTSTGGGLTAGQIINLDVASPGAGTVNQYHWPALLVMATTPATGGAMTAWEWLDYGSYSSLTAPNTLLNQCTVTTVMGVTTCNPCSGMNCVQLVPEWTRGTLATTIEYVYKNHQNASCPSVPVTTCIVPTDWPPGVVSNQPIETFYYGHDDSQFINTALSQSQNGQTIHVTGYCGSTQPINLPDNPGTLTTNNTVLAGDSYKNAGIFAFAWDLASRAGGTQYSLMNHLLFGVPDNLAFGGGVRDLVLEGLGVAQGYGYYSNTPTTGSIYVPTGYVGPAYNTFSTLCSVVKELSAPNREVCTLSSGSVAEVDDAKEAFFDNLAVYDAYGEGNAMFQAGEGDADPTGAAGSDFGSIFMNSDRFAITSNQAGAQDPEFALRLSAHDSQYSNLVAFDGTEADVYEGKGNVYSGLHVESDVLNGAHGNSTPQAIVWTGVPPLAGVATYGLESPKNVILSNMQCDNAWAACVFVGSAANTSGDLPMAITNIAQKCSGFANVWPTYFGVELATGTVGAAVSNVVANPICGIAGSQLVVNDSPIVDPSIQTISQSANTQFCEPSLGVQSGRFYTTPFASPGPQSVAANTLYAMPIRIACTVTIGRLSTYVTTVAIGSACHYGIYGNNGNGQPGSLILDTIVPVFAAGPARSTSFTQDLPPGLFFLVVGCQASPGLEGGIPVGNLIGLTAQTDATEAIESTAWTYGANLPATFPAVTYVANTAVPLVYMTPP